MGSMIERMHNVEKREGRPAKRQKKQHHDGDEEDSVKKKGASAQAGGSGEMGEYLKEKRKELIEGQSGQQALVSHIVDLTAGESETISTPTRRLTPFR